MPKFKEQVDVVIAGGASHVVTLAGACSQLDLEVDILRVGGSSAGATRAAGLAFGISEQEMRALMHKFLVNDYLKDRSWNPLNRFGIYAGDRMYAALVGVFGNKRMGEALIPLKIMVCDLYTRQPVAISSDNPKHAGIKVADALRCSAAIPVFFKAWMLPEFTGNRLYCDGGTAANFALGMFDDSDRRTIGLRLKPNAPDDVRPVRDLASFAEAVAELVMWASDNAHISKKHHADVIMIPQLGSGFDFALTKELIDDRWQAGVDAVKAAKIAGLLG